MDTREPLTLPRLFFIVGTRALLGAGVGLLVSRWMTDTGRRNAGIALITIGAVTTIPAARLAIQGTAKPAL